MTRVGHETIAIALSHLRALSRRFHVAAEPGSGDLVSACAAAPSTGRPGLGYLRRGQKRTVPVCPSEKAEQEGMSVVEQNHVRIAQAQIESDQVIHNRNTSNDSKYNRLKSFKNKIISSH